MDITIREALSHQATALSSIALKAKGYWGYSNEQLDLWQKEFLTVSPEYIKVNRVWVASVDKQLVGFAAVEQSGEEAILDHLWVLPEFIGWRYPETVRWAAVRGTKIVFHPHHTGSDQEGVRLTQWGAASGPYYEKAMMMRSMENT